MKIIDNLKYRGVNYNFQQWVTWNGKLASGYSCEDRALLRDLSSQNITSKTHEEMIDLIDFYIEAYSDLLYTQEMTSMHTQQYFDLHPHESKD